jgi:hypothetical protein
MSSSSLENEHDRPSAPLDCAEQLFIEMIRQVQEERVGDVSFFNASIDDSGVGFSVSAFGGGDILGHIVGEWVVQRGHGLGQRGRDRLVRRGWTLPEEDGVEVSAPSCNWDGITSRADRQHIAQEMLSVAMDIYDLSEGRKIRFQLRLDGTRDTPTEAQTE